MDTHGSLLTQAGRELMASCIAGDGRIIISRVAVGIGTPMEGQVLDELVELVTHKQDAELSGVVATGNGEATVTAQISNAGIAQGYEITEIGLYAKAADAAPDVLYAYVSMVDSPEWMRPESAALNKFLTLQLVVIVSSIAEVIVHITPGSLASKQELQAVDDRLTEQVNGLEKSTTTAIARLDAKDVAQDTAIASKIPTAHKAAASGVATLDENKVLVQPARSLESTLIPAGADLNAYTTPGLYYCPANATVATLKNCPTPNAFALCVEQSAGTGQRLTSYPTAAFETFCRNFYSAWGAWRRTPYMEGNNLAIPGHITARAGASVVGNGSVTGAVTVGSLASQGALTAAGDITSRGTRVARINELPITESGVFSPTLYSSDGYNYTMSHSSGAYYRIGKIVYINSLMMGAPHPSAAENSYVYAKGAPFLPGGPQPDHPALIGRSTWETLNSVYFNVSGRFLFVKVSGEGLSKKDAVNNFHHITVQGVYRIG